MNITTRFSEIVDNFSECVYHILGCGAIGSSAAVQLCRMGAETFVLYDLDSVEIQNIGVSHYTLNDIGKRKVDALDNHLVSINPDVDIYVEFGRFSAFLKPLGNEDIVILGFDSMDSRLDAAISALKDSNKPLAIIDGRMGAEEYQQYTILNPILLGSAHATR